METTATRGRSTSRYVVAAAVVAFALLGGFLLLFHRGSHRVVVRQQTFNSTGTVSAEVKCQGTDPCGDFVKAIAPDGSFWEWSPKPGVPIPPEWLGKTVYGTVTIASDWGDSSSFSADGNSIPLFGGKQDASVGHTFTAVG